MCITVSKIKSHPHHDALSSSSTHRIKTLVLLHIVGLLLPTATSGLVTPINTPSAKCPPLSLSTNEQNEERNTHKHTHNHRRREILRTALLTPLSTYAGLLATAPVTSNAAVVAATISETDDTPSTEPTAAPTKKVPRKPYASLEALLPAARVKYDIDRSTDLTKEILTLLSDNGARQSSSATAAAAARLRQQQIISTLDHLLLDPKNYMAPLPRASSLQQEPDGRNPSSEAAASSTPGTTPAPKAGNGGRDGPKSGSTLYRRTYTDKIRSLPLTDVPLALLTTAGDYEQFNRLKSRQRALEGKNPIRAAFNYYTRQLRFDTEFYVLTASAEDKRRMIRNDALPDIKSVIVSDLDLRDLVRNQILDRWEDCQAEFRYQLRRSAGAGGDTDVDTSLSFDAEELYNLLLKVQGDCNDWFAFIPANDTTEALDVIFKEDGIQL